MKKYIAIAAALLVCACAKESSGGYRGYYSFKTGGSIDITGKVYDIYVDTVKVDTLVKEYKLGLISFRDTSYRYHTQNDTVAVRDTILMRRLNPESGQMRILNGDTPLLKVTMNITGGDPIVFDAQLNGDAIELLPTRRVVPVRRFLDDYVTNFNFVVSGRGQSYENMVIFDLDYSGDYSFAGFDGVITGSQVNCIATRNE